MSSESTVFLRKLSILALFCGGLYLAYELLHIFFILAFSAFLTALFSPALNAMNKKRIPDFIGVTIIYLGIFVVAGTVFATTIPIFAGQLLALFETLWSGADRLQAAYTAGGIPALGLPDFLAPAIALFDPASTLGSIKENAGEIAKSIGQFLSAVGLKGAGVFSAVGAGIADVVLVTVFTFFFVLERKEIRVFFYRVVPDSVEKYVLTKESAISSTLSAWIRGQLFLGLSIFALTLTGLFILEWAFGIRIESRFALALIAGITEFIPYLGPILALLPALALALGISPEAVVAVLILYLIIQQLENNVLVPWLMSKSLDLSPFYVLVMTTVGVTLGGVVGILVALPMAGILRIFAKDLIKASDLVIENVMLTDAPTKKSKNKKKAG